MESIKVETKNNLPKEASSWKNIIPMSTVPTAPIPVHTAYAVPIGKVFSTFVTRYRLNAIALTVPIIHNAFSLPQVLLTFDRQNVKTSSIHPDKINNSQFINICFIGRAKFTIFPGKSLCKCKIMN